MTNYKIHPTEIISDKELIEMYEKNSLLEMDKVIGISYSVIRKRLKELGVKMRTRGQRIRR